MRVRHQVVAGAGAVLTAAFATLAATTTRATARDTALVVVLPLGFTVAGAVALRSRPRALSAAGLAAVGVLHLLAFVLAALTVTAAGRGLDGPASAIAVLSAITYLLGFVALLAVAACLPARTALPPRARQVLRGLVALAVLGPILGALAHVQRLVVALPGWPQEAPGTGLAPALAGLGDAAGLLMGAPVAAAVVVTVRWRRAAGPARRALRWPALVLAVAAAALAVQLLARDLPGQLDTVLVVAALGLVPFALLPALLAAEDEHDERLAAVVRTAVALSALWVAVALSYAAVVTSLDLSHSSRAGLAGAFVVLTGAAPLLPGVRSAVGSVADRFALGPPTDGYALLRDYGAVLTGRGDLMDLCQATAGTVQAALGCSWVRMEMVTGEQGSVGVADAGHPVLSVPVGDGAQVFATLTCGPRRRGLYRERDVEALHLLAGQTALAVRGYRLAEEVDRRLAELEASRHRLALAGDNERRRIERDLHDGAQQDLVSLLTRVELARTLLGYSVDEAADVLNELRGDVVRAITSLRETVLGIHPPVLTDRGLVPAVAARIRDLPLDVALDVDEQVRGRRFPAEVEAAAYYVVVESLTNVLKHAGVHAAHVRLAVDHDTLLVTISDGGRGGATMGAGSGLAGLTDRLAAVGGALHVESSPGAGTRTMARLPLLAPLLPA